MGETVAVPTPGVPNEAVARTYDRLAAPYDWVVSPLSAGTRERALDLLALSPGDRVLEVGSGPGHALVALGRRVGHRGRVVGLDAAPAMHERARSRLARAGQTDRVDLVVGDGRSLPVRDGAVDAVFFEDTLELFAGEDRRRVLAETSRVLADGGRLGVVTMERAGAERDRFVRGYDWAFEHLPGYERFGCRPIYARESLEGAGFDVVEQASERRALVWPVEILVAESG